MNDNDFTFGDLNPQAKTDKENAKESDYKDFGKTDAKVAHKIVLQAPVFAQMIVKLMPDDELIKRLKETAEQHEAPEGMGMAVPTLSFVGNVYDGDNNRVPMPLGHGETDRDGISVILRGPQDVLMLITQALALLLPADGVDAAVGMLSNMIGVAQSLGLPTAADDMTIEEAPKSVDTALEALIRSLGGNN